MLGGQYTGVLMRGGTSLEMTRVKVSYLLKSELYATKKITMMWRWKVERLVSRLRVRPPGVCRTAPSLKAGLVLLDPSLTVWTCLSFRLGWKWKGSRRGRCLTPWWRTAMLELMLSLAPEWIFLVAAGVKGYQQKSLTFIHVISGSQDAESRGYYSGDMGWEFGGGRRQWERQPVEVEELKNDIYRD